MEHSYKVYGNHLYIIESLYGERKTGKWLSEDLLPYSCLNEFFSVEYISVVDKAELNQCLTKIKQEVIENQRLPIIHLEAHGCHEGFELMPSMEFVSWQELNLVLSDINFMVRNNLILSMGVCFGHYINIDLISAFEKYHRCPFLINISPQTDIKPDAIMSGFSAFYRCLLEGNGFYHAMNEMKNETPLNFLTSADIMAEKMVESIKDDIYSSKYNQKTAQQLHEMIATGSHDIPGMNFNRKMKYLKKHKRQVYKEELEKRWRYFMMIDDFEENKTRFLDFEEIWNRPVQKNLVVKA